MMNFVQTLRLRPILMPIAVAIRRRGAAVAEHAFGMHLSSDASRPIAMRGFVKDDGSIGGPVVYGGPCLVRAWQPTGLKILVEEALPIGVSYTICLGAGTTPIRCTAEWCEPNGSGQAFYSVDMRRI